MGIFSNPSAFDPIVDKVTDENKKEEDWGLIMEVCDRVGATTTGPKVSARPLRKHKGF
jgi:signal transducing adaptor molecule